MEQPDAVSPPTRSVLAWALAAGTVVVTPVLLFISAIPTMTQGLELKDAAIRTVLSGGTGVLIAAMVARLACRRLLSTREILSNQSSKSSPDLASFAAGMSEASC